jgi:hypothetical protein
MSPAAELPIEGRTCEAAVGTGHREARCAKFSESAALSLEVLTKLACGI